MSIFTQTPQQRLPSNTFDLSHDRKMAMQMGSLVPTLCMEVIPGDNIRMSTSQLIRLAPMIAPVMHQINAYHHTFFVPNRILWDGWEDFISNPETTRVFPKWQYGSENVGGNVNGSLTDYLGLPSTGYSGTGSDTQIVSAIPFAAYQCIYDQYFRDQNIMDPVEWELSDGINNGGIPFLNLLRTRAWQHDYFTSALPWTQRGPEALIPVGPYDTVQFKDPSETFTTANTITQTATLSREAALTGLSGATREPLNVVSSVDNTIIDLRRAFKLQEWLEVSARGGMRYTETIQAHFGIIPQDARLQRPEYLGGSKSAVSISEVLQTSTTENEPTPQGNMAGHGISASGGNGISYKVQEHGYIISLISVLPKTAYWQGVPKHWKKFDKYDYFWTQFQHIGEQAILNQELFVNNDGDVNEEVFGYTPRYAEYKFINSSVHGAFRESLQYWHMARTFENRPTLNPTFINAAPTKRIFAVEDPQVEDLYVHLHHRISARRPMAYFGQPKM